MCLQLMILYRIVFFGRIREKEGDQTVYRDVDAFQEQRGCEREKRVEPVWGYL